MGDTSRTVSRTGAVMVTVAGWSAPAAGRPTASDGRLVWGLPYRPADGSAQLVAARGLDVAVPTAP
ncbi:hypothetical protein [Streptomyces sp. NPDC001568]|uniref:hypothetical protein n=1 Tax=Streptomyces sp. NPDC001568 TaxID=3364588 RepID=UPI0036A4E668